MRTDPGEVLKREMAIEAGEVATDFFIYPVTFDEDLPAGGVVTKTITIQADADFRIQKLSFAAAIANGPQTDSTRVIPLCNLTITDTGSGRQLMSEPVSLSTIFGTGELPFLLPQPKYLFARSVLKFELTNTSQATTYSSINLSLVGQKVFYEGS